MPCSPAQLAANRKNARLSTGPRTTIGKSVSRRNSLISGQTGEGIVLPHEDAEEVARRFGTFEAEMMPRSERARQLVSRVALMTVRLDRSAEHEAKAISYRMRNAVAEFDNARLSEVEHLLAWIASAPETNARRLRGMPEGVDRLIEAIEGLRADLARSGGYRWGFDHCDRFLNLTGRRYTDLPVHRPRTLTDAIAGNFQGLDPAEAAGLEIQDRRLWAIGQMVDLLDAEIAGLKAHRAGMDLEGLEFDRAEAAARAMFDPSKDAILARKYEAANERAMYRALREFRETQAEPEPVSDPILDPHVAAELGSFSPEPFGADNEAADIDPTVAEPAPEVVEVADPTDSRKKRPRLDGSGRARGRRQGRPGRPGRDFNSPGTSL